MAELSIEQLKGAIQRIDTELDNIDKYLRKDLAHKLPLCPDLKGLTLTGRYNQLIHLKCTANDILNLKLFMLSN